ncbi:MAG: eukaryotic-like serine/threonine-protein kinase [Verrucomicrobiota bacterium]
MTSSEQAQRVAEIVKSAMEREPEDCPAFLDETCAGDAQLRSEVDSLLKFQEGSDRFIERPALHLAAESLVRDGAFRAGQTIGDYEILSLIGTGGMGEVYLAQDRQLNRKVALKFVRRGMDSDDILRRFKHEERLLASLNHPNIAQLYGSGVATDGIPFFAMEYVEGERLDHYCNERQLATEERLQLFRKVCSAITYAHQHLVIHRDIKPANIRVTAEGEPKLLDFGIAKLLDSESAQSSGQTLTVQGVMTPEYASPEQVRGETMTTASDVYSLGVVLYELLSGHRPYRVKTRRADEIARAIGEQTPERPSTALNRIERTSEAGGEQPAEITPESVSAARGTPLDKLRRRLAGDLDNIVLMAMRKELSRRYASVAQFSEDIRRHLEGLPVRARKDTWSYRSGKFVRRHRVGVAAASLVAVSLIGGIVATLIQVRTTEREKVKAEAISAFLQRMLTASDPNRHAGAPPTVKDILDDASKRLTTAELAGQPEVHAQLQRTIGVTYLSLGQYALAEQNLSAALQTQTKLFGEDGVETLKTAAQLATLWGSSTGDYAKTEQFYRKKLPLLRAAQRNGTLSADYVITTLSSLALLRRAQGDSKQAEMLLREEIALGSQVSPELKNDIGIAETVLALTLADQGKFAEAIKIVREKLAELRSRAQTQTPELCATLTGLGSFLLENGEFVEAEEHLREAESVYRQLYDPANMQLGDNLRLQAQALYAAQHYTEAEAKINETLRIYRAASTPQYLNYATALTVQGLIYSRLGKAADAEKLLRQAVQIRASNMPVTHFLRAMTEGALGEFLSRQNDFPEAEPLLLGSYESLKASQAANSPRTRLALQRLANLYEAWNNPDQAARYRALLPGLTP